MSFPGYAVPGAIFFSFGLKWCFDVSKRERLKCLIPQQSTWRKPSNRTNKTNKKLFCKVIQDWPVEGLVKVTVTFLGIAFSMAIAHINGRFQFINYLLNATVYLFFGISGIVDILLHYCPTSLPKGVDKFILSFAFAMEGLMFYLHLSHQSFMQQHVHIILVTAIFACACATISEAIFHTDLPTFAKALFTMIHGSWYVQSGFILHNPTESIPSSWTSSADYNNALTQISLTFACHCAVGIVLIFIIFIISNGKSERPPSGSKQIDTFESPTTTKSTNTSNQCPFCSSEIGTIS